MAYNSKGSDVEPNPFQWVFLKLRVQSWVILLSIIGFATWVGCSMFGTVEKGTYVIKQAAVSGDLSAHMTPGWYPLMWGSISEWPVSEMFDFTAADKAKDDSIDDSIEVTFNDGGKCRISGTCRVILPTDPELAIALVAKHGFRDWEHLEDKLLLQTVRRALMLTANLMSSKESYSNRRAEFYQFARDQIENGIYLTSDKQAVELDPVSGKEVSRVVKEIQKDKNGQYLRDKNPLDGLGLSLRQFDIKDFDYEPKVKQQISTQQDALMAVQTAMANAQKAQQDAITAEAKGKAAVMTAKYEEEEKKARAVVQAEQALQVAVTGAQQLVDVAEKNKQTATIQLDIAKLEKESTIQKATGEAEARSMILQADGALEKKLAAYIEVNKAYAEAFSKAPVPGVVMAGGANGIGRGTESNAFLEILGAKAARDLALDMDMTKQAPHPAPASAPKK